jgi:hypothetical protein
LRALFLLLLLANLLFLAWTRWVEPGVPATGEAGAPAAAALRPIRLQQEAPQAAGGTDAAGEAGRLPGLAAASCVSVGPYGAEAQAIAAAAELRRLGFESRLRAAQDEVRVGFWVRVPDLATPADAGNALAALRAAGLAEAEVLSEGDPGNVVSVGVFTDAARAAEVAAKVQQAGLTAETIDRVRPLDVFWLDVDRLANGGLPALEDAGTPPEGALPLELRACPSAPVAEPAAGAAPATTPG